MFKRKVKREKLKKLYKIQKDKDRAVGRKMHNYLRFLLWQKDLPEEEQNKEQIKETKEELRTLKQQERFRDNFKSFSMFKKFIKKEKFSMEELEEIVLDKQPEV